MIRLKIDEITAGRTSPMETVFWGTDAPRVSDLLAALGPLEDAMPLGWQYRSSLICSGLWARAGAFCSTAETFVDAFDHTVFRETVWNYSEETADVSRNGLELHGWSARPNPKSLSGLVLLETAGELKRLLSSLPGDLPVFSPSSNFELKGWLKNAAGFYCVKDGEGTVWLMLQTDSRAGENG